MYSSRPLCVNKTPGAANFARFEMAEVLSQIGQALSLSCHSTSEDFDPLTQRRRPSNKRGTSASRFDVAKTELS